MKFFGLFRIRAQQWRNVAPEFLPFADAATDDLPLSRLLRLSLFQVTVGMATVLLVGTLNRVMIVEMGMAAWIVSLMVALPILILPGAVWIMVVGVTKPLSSARLMTKGFMVEPGSNVSVRARLRSCSPLRFWREAGE